MSPDREPPRRFLVPVATSEDSSDAVELAADLARATGGSMTLLGVVPLAMPPATAEGSGALALTLVPSEDQDELDRIARERLEELAGRYGDGVPVRTAMDWGTPDQVVRDELRHGDYGMVVVSDHHNGLFGRLGEEHAIHKLLRHSPVPVVVVPAGESEDES